MEQVAPSTHAPSGRGDLVPGLLLAGPLLAQHYGKSEAQRRRDRVERT